MSKKPVPSKKQAPSSTKSRHQSWVRSSRKKLENAAQLTKCPNCGATHRMHFACSECGFYAGKEVLKSAQKTQKKPIQEIQA